jgi:holliday junction DNA helicase RuvB
MAEKPLQQGGFTKDGAGNLDQTLRPQTWEEYIGQRKTKENLRILLTAARERGHASEHILLYGPPGLGKTTLAHLISKTLGTNMRTTSGPAIERVGDLAAILTNLSPGDVLFIDEIHRLSKSIEEVLYPAMESGVLDIIIGKGPSARTVQLELPPFTLVAATTRISLLSSPLRSRFSGGTFRLEFYSDEEIAQILKRSAELLQITTSDSIMHDIATRCRATPRTANYLLKRCRDLAQLEGAELSTDIVNRTFALLEIDSLGLGAPDRAVLEIIINKFGGGPVGLNTIAAATGEEQATIEDVIEPYLIRQGLLERTPRGRIASASAYSHITTL